MNGIESIAAERMRQTQVLGWTWSHDDEHEDGELALASAAYILQDFGTPVLVPGMVNGLENGAIWPWPLGAWKPKDRRSNLVRAGALIAAEIDRLDRAAVAPTEEPKP